MADEHEHRGQDEPRSYGPTHHEQKKINLNSVSLEALSDLPMVGPHRAKDIVSRRPFKDWSDVEKIPGFSPAIIDDLKSGGAHIG